jgi:putative ABC transport system permease protein
MRYLPLLWTGLFRKKTRTILTLLSIFVAFVLFGLLQAVKLSFAAGAQAADARRMLTTPRYGLSDGLPRAYLQQIEQVEGVVGISYMIWFGGKYRDKENAFGAFAVDPRRYLDMYPEAVIAPDQREAFINTRTGAIVGRTLLERYGWKLGQKLPIHSEIHAKNDGSMDWEFDLVGILDPRDATSGNAGELVLINNAYFDEARRVGKGTVGWFTIRVNDSYRAQAIADEIDRRFRNSPNETKTQAEREFTLKFAKQIGDIGALVTRILAAVFFTILILTGNTLAQSIGERIPEFAILKTVGFSDGKVTRLVLAEAVLLLLLGGGLGLLTAMAAMPELNAATRGHFLPLSVGWGTCLQGLAILVVLALTIGLPSALRVRRLTIVNALRAH